MPRRGNEIGYLNRETMEWVKTGVIAYPLKDSIDAMPETTLSEVMLEIHEEGEED